MTLFMHLVEKTGFITNEGEWIKIDEETARNKKTGEVVNFHPMQNVNVIMGHCGLDELEG